MSEIQTVFPFPASESKANEEHECLVFPAPSKVDQYRIQQKAWGYKCRLVYLGDNASGYMIYDVFKTKI